MPTPVESLNPPTRREAGRELACEAIFRSQFGQAPTGSGEAAMAQLRAEQEAGAMPAAGWHSGRRRLWLSAAAAVLLLGLGWLWLATRYPGPAASGDYRLAAGQALGRGTSLSAGSQPAILSLGGYCSVTVDPGSSIQVRGQPRDEAIALESGAVACAVDRHQGTFRVETGLGTVHVTGTRFRVALLGEEEKQLSVQVSEGTVLVTGPMGEKRVGAGEEFVWPERQEPILIPEEPAIPEATAAGDPRRKLATFEAELKQAVANGRITEAQARERLASLQRRLAGASRPEGTPREKYVAAEAELRKAVADGKMTQEQADARLEKLRQRLRNAGREPKPEPDSRSEAPRTN